MIQRQFQQREIPGQALQPIRFMRGHRCALTGGHLPGNMLAELGSRAQCGRLALAMGAIEQTQLLHQHIH